MGRCLAPDLIGMGASGKAPDGSYRFVDHARYLDAWFEQLELTRDVTLVVHDWGSALGFHWANRHRAAVKGIAYMEAIVAPLQLGRLAAAARNMFQALRSPGGEEDDSGEERFRRTDPAGQRAAQFERGGDGRVSTALSPSRAKSRRPMLTWPRQIPIEGDPADVTAIVDDYATWLAGSSTPQAVHQRGSGGDPDRTHSANYAADGRISGK